MDDISDENLIKRVPPRTGIKGIQKILELSGAEGVSFRGVCLEVNTTTRPLLQIDHDGEINAILEDLSEQLKKTGHKIDRSFRFAGETMDKETDQPTFVVKKAATVDRLTLVPEFITPIPPEGYYGVCKVDHVLVTPAKDDYYEYQLHFYVTVAGL